MYIRCIAVPSMILFYYLVRCYSGSMDETESCCTIDSPCKIDQGDCDHDAECEEDLVCGNDNCGNEFTWNSADCCTKPG